MPRVHGRVPKGFSHQGSRLAHFVDGDIDLGIWAVLDVLATVVVADCHDLLGQDQLERAEAWDVPLRCVVSIIVAHLVADLHAVRVVNLGSVPRHRGSWWWRGRRMRRTRPTPILMAGSSAVTAACLTPFRLDHSIPFIAPGFVVVRWTPA